MSHLLLLQAGRFLRFSFCVLVLIGYWVAPTQAQSAWKAAADSSALLFKTGNIAKAYEIGLRVAVAPKPAIEADSVWSAVLQVSRRLPDSVAVSTLLLAGKYYFDQNETDTARSYLTKAISEGTRLDLPQYYLKGYLLLAKIELRNGAQDKAVPLYERVLNDTNSQQCPGCRVEALLGLTDVYLTRSQFDSATSTAQKALALLEQLPDFKKNFYYPLTRLQLSRCAYITGDMTRAIEEIEESYSVAKVNMPNDPYLIAIGYFYMYIVSDINDEKALEAIQTARRVLQRQPNYSKHPYYLPLLANEIAMFRTLGRNDEAVLSADSVFQRHSLDELGQLKNFVMFLHQANLTYIKAKRDVDVERIAKKAQQLLTSKDQGGADPSYLHGILGRYHQYKRNFTEAVRSLKEELRLDSLGKDVGYINHSMRNRLANCQAEAGQRADAYASFSRLVQEFDENARTNLWLMSDAERDNYLRTSVIHGLFSHLLGQPDPQPNEVGLAYNYKLLRQGIRLKMNRTINRFMHSRNQVDSSLCTIRQLIGVRARLADRSLSTDPAEQRQLKQVADSLERIMGNDAITLDQALKTVQWQDIRAKLKPGEAAIELVWYDNYSMGSLPDSNRYSAFLLRPEWSTPKLVHLPVPTDEDDKPITENTQAYIDALSSAKNQRELFEEFWQPIAKALGPVKRIYVALDGRYQALSLPTIYNFRTSKYLLDELDIVVLSSTQDVLDEPRTSSSRVAELIGHPAYFLKNRPAKTKLVAHRANRQVRMRNGLTFEELPYTKTEVQQLGKLLKTFQLLPRVRTDTAASEAAFQKLQSPKIVHVATHGYLRDTSRNASRELLTCGLVLAGAADTVLQKNRTDGMLTGYEASLLNLHDTELVVLSACETGVGDVFEGEGVFGLQRAFRLAGAQSVLMSLWKVNDQLTQQLMTDFYRYWLSGLSKPQALRKAQLTLRKQYPEPYYWGAFVLLGQ